ncbi:MerR family transcriptional regulator [Stieleria marina]
MTNLTVKSLRFYHEQGVLVPSHVESGSGYRFYAQSKIETARLIALLRDLEFSIAEIKQIISSHDDDADIVAFLESRQSEIRDRMRNDRRIDGLLKKIIHHEKEAVTTMTQTSYEVEEKTVDPMLVASIRMKGKYSDCGSGFGKIGRKFGRHICGKAMMLHHDGEYKADDADFEAAMPIKKGTSTDEISVHQLPGGRCLSLMHLGPYEELRRSYEKMLTYISSKDMTCSMPTREVYHKGPGMIFRGNPKKYLTEIQFMVESE